ncbi:hypothetical protein JOD63_000079 [Microbacterium terrae]|uniref:Cellulase (Glycosyl hydrolase family 5) n=1 Tax=Microbacterium terrae TaxID=69369 RepID=A0A0M2H4M6_9MICO|nr:cellulase family glycosylhydrolase [Microbacterium terrae]KJL38692.1 Cellulase (glycosyl hydrolase family 5) [Microbacterium terrae]MBP1076111.1 hypothetical protein [Microbacterium terrae]GLJ96931.1 hypothetical protein GCM10017594_01280 [Microbacterium terrae]
MKSVRRPVVALATTVILVALQAFLDPTGLLALVGWSGALPALDRGLWPLAPYVVFVPVLLVTVWWAALRAGDRYWTLVAGVVLAVVLAQAVTCLAMTGDLANSAWAAGYVTAKAVPAALLVAAITRLFGGRTEKTRTTPGAVIAPALLFAATAPLLAGQWWTAVVYAPGVPVARPDRGIVSTLVAVVLLAAITAVCLRWMRARVSGVLGGWLAALVGAAAVGLVQAVVALIVEGMPSTDLWPLMSAYVAVADGVSFGACLGWVAGVGAIAADRLAERGMRRVPLLAAAVVTVAALVVTVVTAVAPARGTDSAASVPDGFLRAEGGVITDGDGDQILLRGANVNQLVDFYAPNPDVPVTTPLTEDDFAQMAAQGFNVARLGISWSALEPVRGEIDEDYLAQIVAAVEWGGEHGVRTVLDMHQDSWWNEGTPESEACRAGTAPMWGYDGAPGWATITDSAPRCQFEGRDISPASDRAFQNFYFDTDGVQSALVETWARLGAEFADEPAVAGFDLLNEPGFGETAPVTTSLQLGRFYDRAITAIREAGAPQIVFIEPSILWSGLGFDTGPAVGFTDDDNIVFAPHLYAESITMDRALGITPIVGMERQFALAQRAADAYGYPLWSGEYGYWGEQPDREARLTRYAALEDEYRIGGAYWVWKQACGDPQNGVQPIGDGLIIQDCEEDGWVGPNQGILDILSRAYPRSAPGELTSLAADGASIALEGGSPSRSCGLDVWVPGSDEPAVVSEGLSDVEVSAVDGGWTISGCADGAYALTAGASTP